MIPLKNKLTLPAVGLTGFETPLTDEESAIQASVHRFAKEVLRPAAQELDRMSAADVIAPGSPFYTVYGEFAKLGLDPALLDEMPPEIAAGPQSAPFQTSRSGSAVAFPRARASARLPAMNLDVLLFRYFGATDLGQVPPNAREAGIERIQVDFGLATDRGHRFALWALLHLLGSAPDIEVAFKDRADRDAARSFLDLLTAAGDN